MPWPEQPTLMLVVTVKVIMMAEVVRSSVGSGNNIGCSGSISRSSNSSEGSGEGDSGNEEKASVVHASVPESITPCSGYPLLGLQH